jgi:hypothetical protein
MTKVSAPCTPSSVFTMHTTPNIVLTVCVIRPNEKYFTLNFTNGMTKTDVDSYFSDNYDYLYNIARGLAYRHGRKYDPCILLTEGYEHALKNLKQIQSIDQLQRYIIAKVCLEVSYSNSKTSRENCLQSLEVLTDERPDETDIEGKLNADLREMNARGLIVAYHLREKDPVKRIFFEAYFIKGYSTVRSIAEYFKLSRASAHQLIKEMQSDVRAFAYYNNINLN